MRDLYVGALGLVPASIFPGNLDYLGLGHLHSPQTVDKNERIRYSGSPLPLGFGEAGQTKSVCLVEFANEKTTIRLLEVPEFQKLERINGSWERIASRLETLRHSHESVWLEIIHDGENIIADLRERLDLAVKDTELEILCVKNRQLVNHALFTTGGSETLAELDESEVFERCLNAHKVPVEQQADLRNMYKEILHALAHDESSPEEGI